MSEIVSSDDGLSSTNATHVQRYREILEELLTKHGEMTRLELADRIAEVFKLGQDAGDDPGVTTAVDGLGPREP